MILFRANRETATRAIILLLPTAKVGHQLLRVCCMWFLYDVKGMRYKQLHVKLKKNVSTRERVSWHAHGYGFYGSYRTRQESGPTEARSLDYNRRERDSAVKHRRYSTVQRGTLRSRNQQNNFVLSVFSSRQVNAAGMRKHLVALSTQGGDPGHSRVLCSQQKPVTTQTSLAVYNP